MQRACDTPPWISSGSLVNMMNQFSALELSRLVSFMSKSPWGHRCYVHGYLSSAVLIATHKGITIAIILNGKWLGQISARYTECLWNSRFCCLMVPPCFLLVFKEDGASVSYN